MNGLKRLWALGARLERLAAERVTVKVDGKPLWRELLDIAGQIECEQAEPGGGMRPGLKVLGLDFKELREGEEVWSTKLGKLVTISHVRPNGTVTLYNHGCTPFRSLDFTHEVPPLDADGVEIRAGDVLYSTETGESVTVEAVEPGNPWFASTSGTLQHCSKFTHERPESECRDCAHWQKDPAADSMGVCWFLYHEYEGEDCYAARRGDCGACEEFVLCAENLAGGDAS